MKRQQRVLLSIGVVLGFVLGVAAGWIFFGNTASGPASTDETGRKVLYWHDPMVAGPKFDKPGKSPFMDMDLVPVYADETNIAEGPSIVTVRPEIVNSLGVRTAPVTRGKPVREVSAHGYIIRRGNGMIALVDIFERDAAWVRPGFNATVYIAERAGKAWPAVVEAVERDLDVGSRSTKIRARLNQVDASLMPDTPVELVVRAAAASSRFLHVPREAVIRTGTRTSVVLALGGGRFQPADVMTGVESGDYIEITKGLNENDRVVVSGQFLIDSDASARATFKRMETPVDGEDKKP